jgi:hypothetical protein
VQLRGSARCASPNEITSFDRRWSRAIASMISA